MVCTLCLLIYSKQNQCLGGKKITASIKNCQLAAPLGLAAKVVALVVQGSVYPQLSGGYSDPWTTNAMTSSATTSSKGPSTPHYSDTWTTNATTFACSYPGAIYREIAHASQMLLHLSL